MTAFVEGEDEIVVGDILTCRLEVKYYNLNKGQKSGYVHSKTYRETIGSLSLRMRLSLDLLLLKKLQLKKTFSLRSSKREFRDLERLLSRPSSPTIPIRA